MQLLDCAKLRKQEVAVETPLTLSFFFFSKDVVTEIAETDLTRRAILTVLTFTSFFL